MTRGCERWSALFVKFEVVLEHAGGGVLCETGCHGLHRNGVWSAPKIQRQSNYDVLLQESPQGAGMRYRILSPGWRWAHTRSPQVGELANLESNSQPSLYEVMMLNHWAMPPYGLLETETFPPKDKFPFSHLLWLFMWSNALIFFCPVHRFNGLDGFLSSFLFTPRPSEAENFHSCI